MKYYSTKVVNAEPMTRQEYLDLRGWQLPADECGTDPGYLVEDLSGPANTGSYNHYVSWLPKELFELSYSDTKMSFGQAIEALKAGYKVARKGWNGKGMWLILVPGTPVAELREGTPYKNALNEDQCEILPHIDMWTTNAEGRRAMLCGWLASQSDMLAEDWVVVT